MIYKRNGKQYIETKDGFYEAHGSGDSMIAIGSPMRNLPEENRQDDKPQNSRRGGRQRKDEI